MSNFTTTLIFEAKQISSHSFSWYLLNFRITWNSQESGWQFPVPITHGFSCLPHCHSCIITSLSCNFYAMVLINQRIWPWGKEILGDLLLEAHCSKGSWRRALGRGTSMSRKDWDLGASTLWCAHPEPVDVCAGPGENQFKRRDLQKMPSMLRGAPGSILHWLHPVRILQRSCCFSGGMGIWGAVCFRSSPFSPVPCRPPKCLFICSCFLFLSAQGRY